MSDEQYDVSEKMRKLFEVKQKQRAEAKQYFQNLLYNPHRPEASPIPFDTQLHRLSAMSAYHATNFQPTAKHYSRYIVFLSPFIIFYYILSTSKANEERILRSGVVKYSDRKFRQIY